MRSFIPCTGMLLVLLTGAACTREKSVAVADTMGPMREASPVEVRPAAATAPYDLQFLDTMILHHMRAIDTATIAESRLQNRNLLALARQIPVNQKREISQMKEWRQEWYSGAPSAANMMMPGMGGSMMNTSRMKTLAAGPGYDAMFIDMMIPHHQGAVQMGENALAKAEHPELKELSKKIVDAQTLEIEMMKKLRAKLPNPPGEQ